MFNIYKNPPLLVRFAIIIVGLILCAVAGHAQSILALIIGLSIGVFGMAIGDKSYLNMLSSLVTKILKATKDVVYGIWRK